MRVFILGGTRFIGPATLRQLLAAGHDPLIFSRRQLPADLSPQVRALRGERAELARFAGESRAFRPDVVLDMFAWTARDVADAQALARASGARRLVMLSSQDVYRAFGRLLGTEPGPPDAVPLTEDSPLRERLYPYRSDPPRAADDPDHWRDEYDKIPAERAALAGDTLPGTVLRLPAVYGPGDHQHRTSPYLRQMDGGAAAVPLDARASGWHWTRGYVEDIAAAIALAVASDDAAGRIYNVGEPDALSEEEWIRAIGEAAGWHGEVVPTPPEQLPDELRLDIHTEQQLIVDSTRIRHELGYAEQLPRLEALRRTVAWERAHPPADTPQ